MVITLEFPSSSLGSGMPTIGFARCPLENRPRSDNRPYVGDPGWLMTVAPVARPGGVRAADAVSILPVEGDGPRIRRWAGSNMRIVRAAGVPPRCERIAAGMVLVIR